MKTRFLKQNLLLVLWVCAFDAAIPLLTTALAANPTSAPTQTYEKSSNRPCFTQALTEYLAEAIAYSRLRSKLEPRKTSNLLEAVLDPAFENKFGMERLPESLLEPTKKNIALWREDLKNHLLVTQKKINLVLATQKQGLTNRGAQNAVAPVLKWIDHKESALHQTLKELDQLSTATSINPRDVIFLGEHYLKQKETLDYIPGLLKKIIKNPGFNYDTGILAYEPEFKKNRFIFPISVTKISNTTTPELKRNKILILPLTEKISIRQFNEALEKRVLFLEIPYGKKNFDMGKKYTLRSNFYVHDLAHLDTSVQFLKNCDEDCFQMIRKINQFKNPIYDFLWFQYWHEQLIKNGNQQKRFLYFLKHELYENSDPTLIQSQYLQELKYNSMRFTQSQIKEAAQELAQIIRSLN